MIPKSGYRFSEKIMLKQVLPTRMVEMIRKSTFLSDTRRAAGRFVADERAATAIEYALIASGIGAAIVSIVYGVGNTVANGLYTSVANQLR
jgi:pilus assembly protein Flp/PilA